MKIIKLTAENVKRLQAVEITPDGNLVVVGGRNAQGKTSVLDAVAMALGGKAEFDPRPVRAGAAQAKVVAELDDLVVSRTINASGTTSLVVASKDGARYPSPQTMLDKLVGRLSFDPLAFINLDPKRQMEALRDLVGLDLSYLDAQRQKIYEERTGVHRDLRRAQDQAESMQSYPDAPDEPLVALDLVERREGILKHNFQQKQRAQAIQRGQDEVDQCTEAVKALKEKLEFTENLLQTLEAHLAELPVPEQEQSTAEVDAEIAGLNTVNEQVAANKAKADAQKEADGLRQAAAALTKKIAALDQDKAAKMAAAAFPVEGLGFDEAGQGITFNGLPFVQASGAEQLRVSVAMGLAANPMLRVLLIKDGSLLDDDNLRLVAEMAAEADAQVWIERVGAGQEVSVVIEDGAVLEARGQAAAPDEQVA